MFRKLIETKRKEREEDFEGYVMCTIITLIFVAIFAL